MLATQFKARLNEIENLYNNAHACCEVIPEAIDLTGWQKVFEQVMRDTYDGKIKPGQLTEQHVKETYQELNKAAGTGYGKNWVKTNDKGKDGEMRESNLPDPRIVKMKRNLYKFSAAKNASMLAELNDKLYKDGELVSFEEFKLEAQKLNIRYNENYLQAEYQTARQSGHMAQKWESIDSNRKLFPNLKYKTQGDSRVRPEHEKLDGIIAPIDSPFWAKYYPPNGWRCRCDVVQTAENASIDMPDNFPEVQPEFEINIGITGQTFKEEGKDSHKFFALTRDDKNWVKAFEMSKLDAPYDNVYTAPNGAKVDVSIYADEKDLSENINCAIAIADNLDKDMKIRPHVNIPGVKNPELEHKGLKGDRVSPKGKSIKSVVNDAFKKKLGAGGQLSDEDKAFLGIELHFELSTQNLAEFTQQAWSKFNNYSQKLDFVIFYKGFDAVEVTREDLKKGYAEFAYKISTLTNKKRRK